MSLDDLIQKLPSAERMREIQDKASDIVKQLSQQATRFGDKYRLRGPVLTVGVDENPTTLEALFHMLNTRGHRFVIGRQGDTWDVFHSETSQFSNLFTRQVSAWTRIQACRLEIKVVFIRHAKKLFTDYFKHIAEFLENAPKEIAHADAVIRELQELMKPVAAE